MFGAGIVALVILAAAPAQMPLSLVVAGLVGLTVSGAQAIMYALAPGCYPTYVRGTGIGLRPGHRPYRFGHRPAAGRRHAGLGPRPDQVLAVMAPLMAWPACCAWWIGRGQSRADIAAAVAQAARGRK